jgi:hypothetical protein
MRQSSRLLYQNISLPLRDATREADLRSFDEAVSEAVEAGWIPAGGVQCFPAVDPDNDSEYIILVQSVWSPRLPRLTLQGASKIADPGNFKV